MEKLKNLKAFLDRQVSGNKTPSVQYAVFNQDRIIFRHQNGFADIKNQIKTSENTSYNLFSVTKTFTALAILQLAEKGKLKLDDQVQTYLPGLPYQPGITIRQLATHSAGLTNPNPLSWIHLENEHDNFKRDVFFKEVLANNSRMKSKPNAKFGYSNHGYLILGQLIEEISGESYEDFVRKNIIAPLHIDSGEMDFDLDILVNHAKGYQKRKSVMNYLLGFFLDKSKFMGNPENGWKPFKRNYINGASYGGLMATLGSIIIYLRELLKKDCRLLSPEYKSQLFQENFSNSNAPTSMCFSWFKGQLKGHQYFTHAGGGGGFYCEVRIYPNLEIGSAIMFNRSGMRDARFLDKVDQYAI